MTVWYAQNSSVNIDSVNEWNDQADGLGNWLTWANLTNGDTLNANGRTGVVVNVNVTPTGSMLATTGGAAAFDCSTAQTINMSITGGSAASTHGLRLLAGAVLTMGAGTTITGGSLANLYGVLWGTGNPAATLNAVSASGGNTAGQFNAHGVYVNSTNATLSVSGTATGSAVAGGVYYASASTSAHSINAAQGGSGSSGRGVRFGVSATNVTIGTATGGSGSAHGVSAEAGSPVFTVTNAYAGSDNGTYGLSVASGVSVSTVTNAYGGSVAGAHGAVVSSGSATLVVGTAKGGSVMGASGVYADLGICTVNGTDLTGTGYPVSVNRGSVKVAAAVTMQFSDAAGVLKKFYDPTSIATMLPAAGEVWENAGNFGIPGSLITPTRVDASVGNVRKGWNYGDPVDQNVGTLYMPNATGHGDGSQIQTELVLASIGGNTVHWGVDNAEVGTAAVGSVIVVDD